MGPNGTGLTGVWCLSGPLGIIKYNAPVLCKHWGLPLDLNLVETSLLVFTNNPSSLQFSLFLFIVTIVSPSHDNIILTFFFSIMLFHRIALQEQRF